MADAPLLTDRESWQQAWRELIDRLGLPAAGADVRDGVDAALALPSHDLTLPARHLMEVEPSADDDASGWAEAVLARGELYFGRGEFDEAWGQLRKLRVQWEGMRRDGGGDGSPADDADGSASTAAAQMTDTRAGIAQAGIAFTRLLLAELELARGAWTAAWPLAVEAVESVQAIDDAVLASRIFRCRARVHGGLGNIDRAIEDARNALELAGQAGDRAGRVLGELAMADAERARSEHDAASRHVAAAGELLDNHPLDPARVVATRQHARHLRLTRCYEDACHRLRQLGDELKEAGAMAVRGHVLCDLAVSYLMRGDESRALNYSLEALGTFMFVNSRGGTAAASYALAEVLLHTGLHGPARERYEQSLDLREAVDDHSGRIESMGGLARLAQRTGSLDETVGWLIDALEVAEATGAEPARAGLILDIGRMARARRRYPEARERFEEALAIRERLGDDAGQAAALVELASLARREGRRDMAEERLRDALRILTRLGDDRARADVLLRIGELRERARDLPGAEKLFEEARAICQRVNDSVGAARSMKRLGDLRHRTGQFADARDFYGKALPLVEAFEPPDPEALRTLLDCLGASTFAQARRDEDGALVDRAREYWMRCLAISRQHNDPGYAAATRGNIGILERFAGNRDRARELLTESARVCRQHNRGEDAARAWVALAGIAEADAESAREQGEDPRALLQRALDMFREAWAIDGAAHSRSTYPRYQALLFKLADEHRERKDVQSALRLLRASSDLARDVDDSAGAARAAIKAGEALLAQFEPRQAVAFFERARELLERAGDDSAAGEVALRLAQLYIEVQRPELVRIAAFKAKALFERVQKTAAGDEAAGTRARNGAAAADDILAKLPQSPGTALLDRLRDALERQRQGELADAANIMRDLLKQTAQMVGSDDRQMAQAANMLADRVRELLVSVLRDLANTYSGMGHTGAARGTLQEALEHFRDLGPDSLPEIRADVTRRLNALGEGTSIDLPAVE